MLYSLACCCDWFEKPSGECDGGIGVEEAQLRRNGLFEFGIVRGVPLPLLLIWARTEAACAGVLKVRKQ